MDNSMCDRTIAIAIPIPIQKTSSFENKELSLNTTSIDPTTMSPPNNFMNKLVKRMDTYYSPGPGKQSILHNYEKYDNCHYVNVSTSN